MTGLIRIYGYQILVFMKLLHGSDANLAYSFYL